MSSKDEKPAPPARRKPAPRTLNGDARGHDDALDERSSNRPKPKKDKSSGDQQSSHDTCPISAGPSSDEIGLP